MSSREIAELIGKNHSNIKISAERLHASGVIGTLAAQEFKHNGNSYTEYLLNKRDSIILVAQNCPEFTARLVDRWKELEEKNHIDLNNPAVLRNALLSYTEKVIELEAKVEEQRPSVEFVDHFVRSEGCKGFREVCKLLNANENEFREFLEEKKIMYRLGGRLTPFAQHLEAGRFSIKAGVSRENEKAFTQAKFTTKGVSWIAGLWMAKTLEGGEK